MRTRTHKEEHFTGSDAVKDVVIGMADGLTVPFALAAGITGAINAVHLVITAGVAEIAAGAIAMGLGGYLAARSEAEHYDSEQRREEWEIRHLPRVEEQEIVDIFAEYGLSAAEVKPLLAGLKRRPEAWRDFMMRFELGLERPHPKRALRSAITIAVSYIVGGAIPLAPYVLLDDALLALPWSAGVTLNALAVFGFVKGHFTGVPRWKSAAQTVLVGSLAAGTAFAFARLLG
jgi:VIT1/CCC1 family predicted Fe2+/Mn2+ transporter